MATPNYFDSNAFSMVSLTAAINRMPNMYGRLNALNLFPSQGVSTRSVVVEEMAGVLNLLPTVPVGAPGTLGTVGKRTVRSFLIPHIPHDDTIMPEEIQGVRVFGSENAMEATAAKVAEKLATMRAKHAITLEYLRMGALKGIILDADGSTLYNLYTEFGIAQKTINVALTTSTTEVILKVLEAKRHIEDNLKGEVMTRFYCLCSADFYDALTTHPEVEKAYQYYLRNQQLGNDYRTAFEFGNVTFEEYRGTATDAAGNTRAFIAAGEAHMFPLGTMSTFKTWFAPADFNETVNTLGIELYAKQEERKFGRGWDLHTQSNPLPICCRPELLVKLTKS